MAYGYGLVGIASISTTASQIGATTANPASGAKIAIRVFDAAITSTANSLILYNGTSATGVKTLVLNKDLPNIASNAGWLFDKGCFAVGVTDTASPASVSYIQEII
jgi:hypothetical protein